MKYRNNYFSVYGVLKDEKKKGDFVYLVVNSHNCNVLVKDKVFFKKLDYEKLKNEKMLFPVKALAFDSKIYYVLDDAPFIPLEV